MSNEKVYLKGINFKQGKYGIRASVKVTDFIATLTSLQNEKGFVNFNINERKEADKFGNTHTAVLDTWQPQPKDGNATYQNNSKPQVMEDDAFENLPF